jgi:hypothetical protein
LTPTNLSPRWVHVDENFGTYDAQKQQRGMYNPMPMSYKALIFVKILSFFMLNNKFFGH